MWVTPEVHSGSCSDQLRSIYCLWQMPGLEQVTGSSKRHVKLCVGLKSIQCEEKQWREADACREEVRRKMKGWSVFFLSFTFGTAQTDSKPTAHPLPSSLACLSESYCVSAGELQLTCCHSLHHSPWANYSLQQPGLVSFRLSCMLSAWAQKGGCVYFCLFVSLSSCTYLN